MPQVRQAAAHDHGRADANRPSLHSGNQRLVRLGDRLNEAEDIGQAAWLARCEFHDIVAGGEHIALST